MSIQTSLMQRTVLSLNLDDDNQFEMVIHLPTWKPPDQRKAIRVRVDQLVIQGESATPWQKTNEQKEWNWYLSWTGYAYKKDGNLGLVQHHGTLTWGQLPPDLRTMILFTLGGRTVPEVPKEWV